MDRKSKIGLACLIFLGVGALAYSKWEDYRIRKLAAPHLTRVNEESAERLDEVLRSVDIFFEEAKGRLPNFAGEAFNWGSKWKLIKEKVGYSQDGEHEQHIKTLFEGKVFSGDDLRKLIEEAVRSFENEIESLENKMLVSMQIDQTLPKSFLNLIQEKNEATLQRMFQQKLMKLMADVHQATAAEVTADIIQTIAAEVLTQMTLKMAVYGVAAAAAPATLGASLVVGLLVDEVITWIFDWYRDPTDSLSRLLSDKLDEMQQAILKGSPYGAGLREKLSKYAAKRSKAREEAILAILKGKQL